MPAEPYRTPSWRGIEFVVQDQDGTFGRATAVHEYPFRDPVWVEDLGRGTRKLGLRGFMVGDDVAALEREMIEAAEEEGPGELVHPTLGLLRVSLVDFRSSIRHDLGRVVELQFLFIESGEQRFPGVEQDTASAVEAAADKLDTASAADFVKVVTSPLQRGLDVVRQVRATVSSWTAVANRYVADARAVMRVVGMVAPGAERRFSRLVAGYRRAVGTVNRGFATAQGAISAFSRAQRGVTSAVARVQDLAARL